MLIRAFALNSNNKIELIMYNDEILSLFVD